MKNILILSLLTLVFAAPIFAQEGREEIVMQAPVQPEFPGGIEGMTDYIVKNAVYPKAAKDRNIQETVYVEFVVEKDGSVSTSRVLSDRGGNPELQKEAKRIVDSMPKWKPAEDGEGNIVRTLMTIPIMFDI